MLRCRMRLEHDGVYQTHADKKCAESIFATVPQKDLRFQRKFQGLEIFFQKPLGDGCSKSTTRACHKGIAEDHPHVRKCRSQSGQQHSRDRAGSRICPGVEVTWTSYTCTRNWDRCWERSTWILEKQLSSSLTDLHYIDSMSPSVKRRENKNMAKMNY